MKNKRLVVVGGALGVLLGDWGDPYDSEYLIQLLGAWGPCR